MLRSNPRDPRVRLSAVIISLQVLGQVALGFKLSVAQILVTIAFCAVLEIGVTRWRSGRLTWPASAILTGNSVALFLRAAGTQHGEWWSLNGIQYFLLAALIGLGAKYLIRVGGRHVYNPSNVGLVVVLLLAGPTHVYPQYLWWGPIDSPAVVLAWLVIIAGGTWVLWRLGMVPVVATFLLTFTNLTAILASTGACFAAVWRATPVCGANYWIGIAASPEVAIFMLLMMTDPRTVPAGDSGRAVYGIGTALLAGGLIALQPTEWGIKLSLLAALTIACTFVPLIDRLAAARSGDRRAGDEGAAAPRPARARLFGAAPIAAAALATAMMTVGVVDAATNPAVVETDRPAPGGGGGVQQ